MFQGSILAPTLFNIYISDLFKLLVCNNLSYADDVKIYNSIRHSTPYFHEDMKLLQADIDTIVKWSEKWELPLNNDKCAFINFQTSAQSTKSQSSSIPCYFIDNKIITQVKSQKDLGIIIDDQLNFDLHIDHIVHNALRANFSIMKCFHFSSLDMKIRLYKAFVRPQIEFASCIWNPISKFKSNNIEKVQRRVTRHFMYPSKDSYTSRLIDCNLLNLSKRRSYIDCCKLYKIINCPSDVINLQNLGLELSKSINRTCDIKQKFVKNEWSRKEFSRRVTVHWNSIPKAIRQINNYSLFKKRLLSHIITATN